jgi:hypothetical protein
MQEMHVLRSKRYLMHALVPGRKSPDWVVIFFDIIGFFSPSPAPA